MSPARRRLKRRWRCRHRLRGLKANLQRTARRRGRSERTWRSSTSRRQSPPPRAEPRSDAVPSKQTDCRGHAPSLPHLVLPRQHYIAEGIVRPALLFMFKVSLGWKSCDQHRKTLIGPQLITILINWPLIIKQPDQNEFSRFTL